MKQYLLLCDEVVRGKLEGCLKGIEFLEIQGMNLNGENKFQILATPMIPSVMPALTDSQPELEVQAE